MKKILDTIYHDSSKYFVSNPYPKRGERIEVYIRLIKNDKVESIYLRYIDQGAEILKKMEYAYEKNNLVYYKASMGCYNPIMSYNFNIVTKDKIYFYYQHEILEYLVDNSANFKIIVDYKDTRWMAKSVFYQILPDRFYNARPDLTPNENSYIYRGNRPKKLNWGDIPAEYEEAQCMDFYGGDLYGVIEKLDYIKNLGANAIYLTPIFTSPTMHKYDALDYFEIDPSLGGDEALMELSKKMHESNMKLMLDISINHTSSSSKLFNMDGEFYSKEIGAYNNPDSLERNYYFIDDEGNYESWFGVKTMPSLNYGNEDLRKLIYKDENSALKKWIKSPYNVDAWRFDVADVMARNRIVDVYHEVWREINQNLKAEKSDIVLLAEEWNHTPDMYLGDQWDSTMNYFGSSRPIREFAGELDILTSRIPELSHIKPNFKAEDFKDKIERAMGLLPTQIQYQMLNLIDSHDTIRLHNNPEIDYDVYKGAVITLFGLPGATSIYYGDEKYIDGRTTSFEGARYSMDWSENLEGRKKDIFDLYSTLANLKTKDEVLEFGGFKIVHAKGDVFAFIRFIDDRAYLFTWTRSEEAQSIELDLDIIGIYENFEFVIGDGELSMKDNILKIKFGEKQSSVLRIG